MAELDWQPGDVAVLATKLQDARSLMDQLVEQAGESVPVVCASNGMHGEMWARERFRNVISMLVWLPATYLKPGEVSLFSGLCRGVLDCGPVSGEGATEGGKDVVATDVSEQLCEWLKSADFDAVCRPDMQGWKYAKWITNLGNAAQALVTDDWKSIARMAQAEGEAVLQAAGVDRVTTSDLLKRCENVKLLPIDGKPREGGSSWQSFRRGQSMETAWIEGAMADLAQKVKVPAPVCQFFRQLSEQPRQVKAEDVLQAIA